MPPKIPYKLAMGAFKKSLLQQEKERKRDYQMFRANSTNVIRAASQHLAILSAKERENTEHSNNSRQDPSQPQGHEDIDAFLLDGDRSMPGLPDLQSQVSRNEIQRFATNPVDLIAGRHRNGNRFYNEESDSTLTRNRPVSVSSISQLGLQTSTPNREGGSRMQFLNKNYHTEKKTSFANRLDSVVELTDMEQQLTGTFTHMVSR